MQGFTWEEKKVVVYFHGKVPQVKKCRTCGMEILPYIRDDGRVALRGGDDCDDVCYNFRKV